jgi:energy-coupling factor transporter transmembrane protein EcfT
MIDAFSTPRNRIKTLILLVICCLSAIASTVVGIDENPPGILLALLAAVTFVLAFSHPWRTARKFMFLLLAAVLGFVLFIIVSIVSDSIVQNPASSDALQNLIQSPVNEALSIIFAMLCSAAFLVGVVGAVVMFIRSRSQKP